jgi:WD40 repeat protein
VYGRDRGWAEVARDEDYREQSYGAAFGPDGRLATTSYDSKVRLYDAELRGTVHPAVTIDAPDGRRPLSIAFRPDGARLAVGYDDGPAVTLLDAHTLTAVPGPDLRGITNGGLGTVAWSSDGRTLLAGGQYWAGDGPPVVAWDQAAAGARRLLTAAQDNVMGIVPLAQGSILVATQDPWLGRLGPDGAAGWMYGPPKADFRNQFDKLSVSSDGTSVSFGYAIFGKQPARFDLTERALVLDPAGDARMATPRQDGLPIEGWYETTHPTLGGRPLAVTPYEISRSLAMNPTRDRFVLGADWNLRAFDANGTQLWTRKVPGVVWAVNITGDGRLVVAAYGDGTIRWHRLNDGVELLAFMPLPNRTDWIAWTPEGFYAATPGAHGILRWHVNQGWDASAESIAVEDIPGSYRPEVLPFVLQELETTRALGRADMVEHNKQVMLRTNSHVPPGARLYLLAVGISAYNEDYAKSLRLHYADRDANDLASAIINTQGSLYQVKPQVLLDKDANKAGIMRALAVMRAGMVAGGGSDLAVVHFSGHGAMVDRKLYLLPDEVDARDDAGIKASALSAEDLKGELLELARYGRVLVLLDACHSGATTMDGAAIAVDADALRTSLAAANVTVLTSSKGSETSEERESWQHGAFTKALLDAFNDPAADINRNGLISTTGLATYLNIRVPALTDGKQTPGMEVRFDTTVFAVGQ